MGLLLAQKLRQRLFVVIPELRWIEVPCFGLQNVLGELQHFSRHLQVGNLIEIFLRLSDLVRVVQGGTKETLAESLECDDALALRHDHPSQCHHALAFHCVADDRECFLADLVVGHDVIGAVIETLVDLRGRNEAVDLDRVIALDLQ